MKPAGEAEAGAAGETNESHRLDDRINIRLCAGDYRDGCGASATPAEEE